MKTKLLSIWAIAALLFASCNTDDIIICNETPMVQFSGAIGNQSVSKAAGATWNAGDAIGIFMQEAGGTSIAINMQHTTTGSSAFKAVAGNEMYYPVDGSAVSFIAYYPYKPAVTSLGNIDVDVSSQTNQPAIDLLWSNNATGYSKTNTEAVSLNFSHMLSKLVINATAHESVGATLSGMKVIIKGMNTRNTFNLATGALGTASTKVDITPRTIADGSAYDAIILPEAYNAGGVTVEFGVGADTFIWEVPAITFAAGKEYIYDIMLTRTGVQVTGTINGWLSGPAGLTGATE